MVQVILVNKLIVKKITNVIEGGILESNPRSPITPSPKAPLTKQRVYFSRRGIGE